MVLGARLADAGEYDLAGGDAELGRRLAHLARQRGVTAFDVLAWNDDATRTTAKFAAGSYVVSPGLVSLCVTASRNPTVVPVGNRPISFPAPMIVIGRT